MKILSRLKKVKNLDKIKKKFFVFDCETFSRNARPEGFAFCCMYGFEYKKVFHTIEDFTNEIFSGKFKNKYIFCHWAEFDLNVIFGNIKKHLDTQSIFNGSRFIIAQKDNVLFADSTNIYQTSVEKLGKLMDIPKLDMNTKFGQGKKFKYTQKEIDYCYTDCIIVWKALEKIFLSVQSVRPTLASLTILFYRRFYMPFDFAYNELNNKFFESYYGGRVEVFKLGQTISPKYDINSMYPYIMTNTRFPNPNFIKVSIGSTMKHFLHDLKYFEGQATIKVHHKKTHIGFLPIKKDGKLIFPNGTFTGTWCFPEIRYALKNKIIKILEIKEVLTSYPLETPFKNYVEDLYQKRLKSEGIENVNLKLFLNNLYGKFGERQKFKEIYFDVIPLEFIELLETQKIPHEIKMFNKKRIDCYIHIFLPVKINKDFTSVSIDEKGFNTKIHSIPAFSSYITSQARVYLLENMLKYKDNVLTYTDTDCICMEIDPNLKDSLVLGEFKKEKQTLIEIFGNKNYSELTGEVNCEGIKLINRKIKGIPKKSIKLAENIYEFDTLIKTKRSIRQEKTAGVWETTTKHLSNEYTKRQVKKNGQTSPLLLNE